MIRMRLLVGMMVVVGIALILRLMTLSPGPGAMAGGNTPAPDVALSLKKDAPPTKLSELRGKVVLLDFWATWCGPCRQSIPELVGLQAKYGDHGLQVIGVSVDDSSTRGAVPEMQKELGMNYPVVFAANNPELVKQFAFEALPTLYIIDKKGTIRQVITGYDPAQTLGAKIAPLLDE